MNNLIDLRNNYIKILEFEYRRIEFLECDPILKTKSIKLYLLELKKWHEKIEYRIELLNELIEALIESQKNMEACIDENS